MKNNRINTLSEFVRVAIFALVRQAHRAVALPRACMPQGRANRGCALSAWIRGVGRRELWEDWMFAILMATSLIAIVIAGAAVVR